MKKSNDMNELYIVNSSNIFKGLRVMDNKGVIGTVMECDDLHNVWVIFDGEGLIVEIDNTEKECGGSGYYCFVKKCDENNDQLYTFKK